MEETEAKESMPMLNRRAAPRKIVRSPRRPQVAAFTLMELAVVIVVAGIFVCMFLASRPRRMRDVRSQQCVSNLKQIGVGFRLYANDNDSHYPRFSVKIGTGYVWTNFAVAGYAITTPTVLICPMDTARLNDTNATFHVDFSTSSNGFSNPANQENCLSYFYGVAADETKPDTILVGDRNLTAHQAEHPDGPDASPMWSYAGKAPEGNDPGISLGSNGSKGGGAAQNCGWNSAMHHYKGKLLLGDGSAQESTTKTLTSQLSSMDRTNDFFLFPINSPGEH